MEDYFEWYKVAHVVSVICWMAGMFYLPRIFVYHKGVKIGSDQDLTFQVMEKKLLRFIMLPAMLSTYVFGSLVAYIYGLEALGVWFHIKVLCVLALTAMHGLFVKWTKDFAKGQNKHSEKFYRIINEIPIIIMIIAVTMVIVKPFE